MATSLISNGFRPAVDPPAALAPYPFPEGMEIPRLMPFQEYPWNNDPHLAAEVLRLKKAHNIMSAIETGTCLGSTAMWLAEHFAEVNTAEVNGRFFMIAAKRCEPLLMDTKALVAIHQKTSVEMMRDVSAGLYWLDAHWNDHCPLLDELALLAEQHGTHPMKPCILIHDFFVPGTDFGYDCMPDGRPFNLELILGHLDRIYGEGKWRSNYPTQVAGAKRGWISIEPCTK